MGTTAFLGLGNMGIGMAARLIDAGHDVRVWNRGPGKAVPLAARGAHVAANPADAAAGADAVFAMLADDEASRAVWRGAAGALEAMAPGALAIECSTLSAGWVAELAAAAKSRGLDYVDCPVTGLPTAAAAGELTLLVGAPPETLAKVRPWLDALAADMIHFGAVGTGSAYKLMVNLMGAVQIAGVAEGMAIAVRAGLDPALVAEAIAKGQAASPQVVRAAGRIVADDHEDPVLFAGRLRLKDARYGADLAARLGIEAPLGQAAVELYRRMVDGGRGEINDSGVVRVFEDDCADRRKIPRLRPGPFKTPPCGRRTAFRGQRRRR